MKQVLKKVTKKKKSNPFFITRKKKIKNKKYKTLKRKKNKKGGALSQSIDNDKYSFASIVQQSPDGKYLGIGYLGIGLKEKDNLILHKVKEDNIDRVPGENNTTVMFVINKSNQWNKMRLIISNGNEVKIWNKSTITKRITFNEISKDAITKAVANLTPIVKNIQSTINSIAINYPKNNLLVTGLDDHTAKIYDVLKNTNTPKTTLKGHEGPIKSVAFYPVPLEKRKILGIVVTGSDDKTAKLWDVEYSQCIFTFKEHEDQVSSVAFNHDGNILATGSNDKTVKIWDTRDILLFKEAITQLNQIKNMKERIKNKKTENIIKEMYTDRIKEPHCIATLNAHNDRVSSIVFSRIGNILATGSYDNTVKIWDMKSVKATNNVPIKTLIGDNDKVTSIAFNPEGNLLAVGYVKNTVKIWEMYSYNCIATFKEIDSVKSVSFNKTGDILATSSQLFTNIPKILYKVKYFTFSPNSKLLATNINNETIKLWNVEEDTNSPIQTIYILKDFNLSKENDYEFKFMFSHNSKILAVVITQKEKSYFNLYKFNNKQYNKYDNNISFSELINCMTFSYNDDVFAIATDSNIKWYKIDENKITHIHQFEFKDKVNITTIKFQEKSPSFLSIIYTINNNDLKAAQTTDILIKYIFSDKITYNTIDTIDKTQFCKHNCIQKFLNKNTHKICDFFDYMNNKIMIPLIEEIQKQRAVKLYKQILKEFYNIILEFLLYIPVDINILEKCYYTNLNTGEAIIIRIFYMIFNYLISIKIELSNYLEKQDKETFEKYQNLIQNDAVAKEKEFKDENEKIKYFNKMIEQINEDIKEKNKDIEKITIFFKISETEISNLLYNMCIICQDIMKDDIVILGCDRNHKYHRNCFNKYLISLNKDKNDLDKYLICPICRRKIETIRFEGRLYNIDEYIQVSIYKDFFKKNDYNRKKLETELETHLHHGYKEKTIKEKLGILEKYS